MSLFPIFLKLQGEPALVVGGGALAQPKIEALLRSGATLHVVAPRVSREITVWAQGGRVRWHPRAFRPTDVEGNRLVFAATGIEHVDRAVADECRRQGVLCNAIDDPPYCAFYSPAVVQRGDLQVAISTNGQSPALAQQLRQQLEQQYDETWEERVARLGEQRRQIRACVPPGEERNRLLHQLASDAITESPSRSAIDTRPHDEPRNAAFAALRNLSSRLLDATVRWLGEEDDKVALI